MRVPPASLDEVASDSQVSLLHLRNWRDLGGLPTRSGALAVKPRCFFRSSTPSRFAPAEHRALARLNLRRIVDLRTTAEVNPPGSSVLAPGAQVLHIPLFETARQNWIGPVDQSARATAIRYFEMLQDGLGSLAATIWEVAQEDATPFLVSCSAGRDRTGIVVACILDLIDVSDEAIATDYACSDPFDPDSGRAHAATVLELFLLLRSHYGSVQRMLGSHGIADSLVEALRRQLLTPRV